MKVSADSTRFTLKKASIFPFLIYNFTDEGLNRTRVHNNKCGDR